MFGGVVKMKRHNNLWNDITNINNIVLSHNKAKKGKSFYKEVKMINKYPLFYAKQIQKNLINKTFNTSEYEVSKIFDNKKIRTIYKLPYYPDRIVQHALVNICENIWKNSFIRDTFQSIKGRGTNDARKKVTNFFKKNKSFYVLKFDINKYYPSINNEILKSKIRKKIKCKNTLWLIDNIIDSCNGIPIGNYTSQYFGNIYLYDFDWWIKQQLKPDSYYRYCDDIIVIDKCKNKLSHIKTLIFEKLKKEYLLDIKENWQLFHIDKKPLDFIGFRFFTYNNIKLRKSIANSFKEKVKNIQKNYKHLNPYKIVNSIYSYWGWCKYVNAKKLWYRHIDNNVLKIINNSKVKLKEIQNASNIKR